MPQERGYERQVGVAQPVGLPNASPASFGAGVGEAIADAGQTMHRAELRAYQIERQQTADAENAAAAAKIAAARLDLEKRRAERRSAPAARAAGHAEASTADFDAATAGIADGITDDRVRQSVTAQIGQMRSGFVGGEYAWQVGMAAKRSAEDLGVTADRYSALLATTDDARAYPEAARAWDDAVDGMAGIGDDVREAVRREGHAKLARAKAERLGDTQPAALLDGLDKGVFNDVLDGEEIGRLRNGAQAQVRAVEAQQRAQAAHAITVERDRLAAAEVDLDAGAGTYQDRVALADRYGAIGDESKAAAWRGKAAEFAVVQGSRDWTPQQLGTRIGELEGKAALSAAEARELGGLRTQRTAAEARLKQPGGALVQLQYATGQPVQPIDPADPASLAARGRQAVAAAAQAGQVRVEPILATELPLFRDLYDQGGKGRAQALAAVKAFGSPAAVLGAARQVAGDAEDGDFRLAATLSDGTARIVLQGKDALKARPDLIDDKDAHWVVNTYYRSVLSSLPADQQADLFQAARSYFAARALAGGEQTWDAKKSSTRNRSRGLFADALEAVMGKVGDRGGVARTVRGLIIVPPDMTGEQLERTFARADPDDYARASGAQVPMWSDGARAMTRRELLTMLPTRIEGGLYGFRNRDGGLVLRKDGRPYTVDIRKLAAR